MKKILYTALSIFIAIVLALIAWGIGYKITGKQNPVDWVQYVRDNGSNKKTSSKSISLAIDFNSTVAPLSMVSAAGEAVPTETTDSAGEYPFFGYIPEDNLYTTYAYNENLLHEFGDIALREYCSALNKDRHFYEVTIYQNDDQFCIFERKFEFIPLEINLSFTHANAEDNTVTTIATEYYGTYKVLYEVISIVTCNAKMLDGIDEDFWAVSDMSVTSAEVRETVDSYAERGYSVAYYDLYYTELDLLDVIADSFCHRDITMSWDKISVLQSKKSNSYYSLNKDGKLRSMTAEETADSYYLDLAYEIDLDEISAVDHNHEHLAPMSDVYQWAKLYEDYSGSEENPTIPPETFTCGLCGQTFATSTELVTHKCVTSERPNPDSETPDAPGGGSSTDNPSEGDTEGDEGKPVEDKDKFEFGDFSFKNFFRNLFNPKFWKALLTGNVKGSVPWKIILVVVCACVIIGAVISIVALIVNHVRGK